ncbi:MAG: ACP S-malonyltransferase [Pseudomonadaceae bacterium]|nr:ACP S-malonyltransferase [Pseudomonadaceae bacterium]
MATAFVFPGQGSQSLGMLDDIIATSAAARDTLAEADEALGFALSDVIAAGPESALNSTETTQPALLATSVALYRAWLAEGGATPSGMAGHSLGEYSALVCAGSLEFADALRLVRRRGELMQQSVPAGEGAMAAILGLEDAEVEACCAGVDGVVSAANYNSPGQIVIAGAAAAVDAAIAACKDAGARKAMPLAVSVPSHCALMNSAADALAEELAGVAVAMPTVPVVHNVDAVAAANPDELRAKLVAQLSQPVRWTQCVTTLADAGADTFIECGPGKVLTGLARRINKQLTGRAVNDSASLASALAD